MDENDESLVFVTFWDCRTHVSMTSSVERTDLDFKISVALVQTQIRLLLEKLQSDQGLRCLPFRLYRLDSLLYGRAT